MEANANNALVPNMLLQPLVENSIKYAVERSRGRSEITINATNSEELLTLTVMDTGSSDSSKQNIKKGTGLSNSIERLRNLYGETSTFSIGPYTTGLKSGMEVKITIPLQYATV